MKRSLARNAVYNTIYQLLNVFFLLISSGYAARVLLPEGIGKVAYAQNFVSYFIMFAVLGIPVYGTREIAKQYHNCAATDKLFSELLVLNGLSTAVCVLGYFLLISFFFRGEFLLYAVAGLELVFNFLNIDWYYQGREDYGYITGRNIFVKAVSLAALFLCVRDKDDYIIYGLIHCAGIGCNYLFNVIHAGKTVTITVRGLDLKRHIRPILWMLFSKMASSLYTKVDVSMLGSMLSPASVAYYTNAHKVINIILTLITAISGVFLPRLSYVYQKDRNQYEQYLSLGIKIILLISVPACAGIVLVSPQVIRVLFGDAFLPAAGVLRILSFFTIIKGAGDILCFQAIISAGEERRFLSSRIVGGIANVILNGLLIPRYGHEGAAFASVISEVLVNGVLLRYALSAFKLRIGTPFVFSVIISTACMTVFTALILAQVKNNILALILAISLGVAGYAVMLLITRNDLIYEIVRRKKIRSEP